MFTNYCINLQTSFHDSHDRFHFNKFNTKGGGGGAGVWWRSGSVMDCHTTARGSIPGWNGIKTELHTLRKGQYWNGGAVSKWPRFWWDVKHNQPNQQIHALSTDLPDTIQIGYGYFAIYWDSLLLIKMSLCFHWRHNNDRSSVYAAMHLNFTFSTL